MIPIIEIVQRELIEKPLLLFDSNHGKLKKVWEKLKVATGYQFDSNKKIFSDIYGNGFIFFVHLSKKNWEIDFWNYSGNTSILEVHQEIIDKETDHLSESNYQLIQKTLEDYARGLINCSGCRKQIKIQNVAGKYFAGSYCVTCWETKYKAIEAVETYN